MVEERVTTRKRAQTSQKTSSVPLVEVDLSEEDRVTTVIK
jgi:hypothetical protein